jgi:hypothetical protein
MIAKIRFFLLSNSSNELNHLRKGVSETELKMLIKEYSLFNNDEEDNDDYDDDDDDYSVLDILPLYEVYVFIINDMIDLNNHIFTRESEGEHNSVSDDDEVSETLDKKLDFKIIDRILAPANMNE